MKPLSELVYNIFFPYFEHHVIDKHFVHNKLPHSANAKEKLFQALYN